MTTAEATGRTHLVFYPGAAHSKWFIAQAQLLQSAAVWAREGADPRVQLFDQLKNGALPLLSESLWRARPRDEPSRPGALVWGKKEESIELDSDGADPELAAQGHEFLAEIDRVLVMSHLRAAADPKASTPEFCSPRGLRALVVECVLPSLALGTPVESHPLLKDYLDPKLMAPPKWKVTLPGWQPAEEQASFEKVVRAAFRKALNAYLQRENRSRKAFLSQGFQANKRTHGRKKYVALCDFDYFVQFQILGLDEEEIVRSVDVASYDKPDLESVDPVQVRRASALVSELTGIELRRR